MTRSHYTFQVTQPTQGFDLRSTETFHSGALAHDLGEAEETIRGRYPRALRVILLQVNEIRPSTCAECGHLHFLGPQDGYCDCPIDGCDCRGQEWAA